MRTPYPRATCDPAELARLFAEFNAAIQRSIDEYCRHPQTRCGHGPGCVRAFNRAKARKA